MKTKRYFNLILILTLLLSSSPVFSADFNPNFLISDEELQNYTSMNRADIQAFLSEKGGYLTEFRTLDKNGTTRMASDIIYQASQEHEINPKYLLVKLQKEQSLITTQSPTQKQLDWATGYGVCDSCSMSDPAIQKYKGFGTQVDSAAGIMRWYYENVSTENWIKKPTATYTIDGETVKPANLATAFLYTYTPHIEGNENFWNLWGKWFEQRYPDGTLLQSADDSIIYLIQNGKKRAFLNMSSFISRYDAKFIIPVPATELARYETGTNISLPNYSILKNGVSYYLLDYETLRPFENYEVVRKLGYNPDEIIEVGNTDIVDYKIGKTISLSVKNPLGKIVRLKENNSVYLFRDETYYPITDSKMIKINFPKLPEETVSVANLGELVLGDSVLFKDGTLFGITGSNKIYVVENGKKRHIASEEVYNGLGFKWNNIIWTDEFTGMNHKTGEPIYFQIDMEEIPATPNTIADYETVTPATNTTNPEGQTLEELMVKTPAEETNFIGQKFDTSVDAYLVANYETEEILAGKNIDSVRPLASFTKAMTAYRLLEEGLNLSHITTYNSATHQSAYHQFRIAEGEQVRNTDLFNSLLVSSLNTPAKMLVSNVEKDESLFIQRMNEQANEWGLSKTKFTDTYGYDPKNVGSAREYMTIFKKTTDNVEINARLSLKSYEYDEVLDKDGKPHHYDTHSNALAEKDYSNFEILASKTGYLYEAGANLAQIVRRKSDNKKFIIITMGNADYENRFDEPERLINWTIKNF